MRRSLTVIFLLVIVGTSTRAAGGDWPYDHLRIRQPRARLLVQFALQRSPTIRALLDRLEATDVVAYVVLSPFLSLPTGRTVFLSAPGSQRYLQVALNERNTRDDLVMLLGHELQHVLEVAGEPTVRDLSSFEEFYRRIGRAWANRTFETDQAIAVSRRVRREMGHS